LKNKNMKKTKNYTMNLMKRKNTKKMKKPYMSSAKAKIKLMEKIQDKELEE